MILASCVLRNNAPNSASVADAATNLRIAHVMWSFPFNCMGFLAIGMLPKKKLPPVQLLPVPADMHDESECTLRFMSNRSIE